MYVTSQTPEPKVIDDYEITFDSGQFMSISIDGSVGDTIEFGSSAITVHLAPKLAETGEIAFPAEDIIIMVAHVIATRKITKLYQPLTDQQKAEWKKSFDQASGRPMTH